MRVKNHRLCAEDGEPVNLVRSPNQRAGLSARYLVIHYTAGASAESSVRHLTNRTSKASAHLVIARDGNITQLVPFNRIAFHAGTSRWQGHIGMNRHSIGIELDNAGKLRGGEGQWHSWFGRAYPDDEVVVAAHKFEDLESGWHDYPETQLIATMEAAEAIFAHYGLIDVLGHDDIAPERKKDPGPAFPMDSFRARLVGRASDDFEQFKTTATLNVRTGPGVQFDKLDDSPLAKGTQLLSEVRDGSWHFVEVLDQSGEATLTGWVHGNYIAPVPAAA